MWNIKTNMVQFSDKNPNPVLNVEKDGTIISQMRLVNPYCINEV